MTSVKNANMQGHTYEKDQEPSIRKSMGQYYTPNYIIKYILNKTVARVDIVKNPYIKIIDPSCGVGYFLLDTYDILKGKFIRNIEDLKTKYSKEIYILEQDGDKKKVMGKDYWIEENIHYHLLKHCIYGADKDSFAVKLTIESLMNKQAKSKFKDLNIFYCDSLVRWESKYNWQDLKKQFKNLDKDEKIREFNLTYKDNEGNLQEKKIKENRARELIDLGEFWSNEFDYCVGNPPYIGHKQMDKEYKDWLLVEYREVFRDKSDISFCFFSRILDILSPDGVCGIITSRYFMESPTGRNLRIFLHDNTNIIEILDFYGADIFKGVGVATAIYIFRRYENMNNTINVFKLKDMNYKFDTTSRLDKIIKSNIFVNFQIEQINLDDDRWILISDEVYKIYEKIKEKAKLSLGDIANSFQGIITGCDKAFVLSPDETIEEKIEKDLLKKWIKNKNIEKYRISESDLNLIYSNLITEPEEYPNAIEYISKYSKRLKNRRECKNGIRKWYELQWGREINLFQQPKIIFPYKSRTNRFAIDYDNHYFSADIYGLTIKDEYKNSIPLEYLLGILNSKVYEFYFKLFAKQMGNGIYDYYPNSLLDLNIISDTIIGATKDRVIKIMNLIDNNLYNNIKTNDKIILLQGEIDNIIMDYFEFNSREKEIIINNIKNF